MKLTDFNISSQLHNRWCRFIIQRYLGQFLQSALALDQLCVELSNGRVKIEQVHINTQYVNELLTASDVPLKLIDGFIGSICAEIPWMSLISDSSSLNIDELQLTFQAVEGKTIDENNIASMLGSVVDNLVSSQELARSFYEEEEQQGQAESDNGQDGIRSFTKIIDEIISRFCMTLTNTTLRLENSPLPNSEHCTAVEFRVAKVEFMDEQLRNCKKDGREASTITSQPHGIGAITNLSKFIILQGVELFTDVFSQMENQDSSACASLTSMYMRRERRKQKSPLASLNSSLNADCFTSTVSTIADYQSCHSTIEPSIHERFIQNFSSASKARALDSNPVKFAELSGEECEVLIRMENSEHGSTLNKKQLEVRAKGINVFITPSQIEIIKRFFSSVTVGSRGDSRIDLGKRMDSNDYSVLTKTLEEFNLQTHGGGAHTGLGMGGGNWRKREDFQEFSQISLDDSRNPRKSSEVGYRTLRNDVGQKESTHIQVNVQTIIVILPHDDPMSVENTKKHTDGRHRAVDRLLALSDNFFGRCQSINFNASSQLDAIREHFDELCLENHLRLVGTAVVGKYEVEGAVDSQYSKISLQIRNCDCLEYLTSASNPGDPSTHHYPLVDFSGAENSGQDPHLKIIYSVSNSKRNEGTALIKFGDCRLELDLSLIDRVADLILTRPFFDPTYSRGRLDSVGRRDVMHLSEDLFSNQTISKTEPIWKVCCQKMIVDLRVPMADLRRPRDDGTGRISYTQRHVHPEFVRLSLTESEVTIPLSEGEVGVNLICHELTGEFCGASDNICSATDRKFLLATKDSKDFVRISVIYDPRNKSLKTNSQTINILLPHDHDMSRSLSTPVIQSQSNREGPFSQIRRSFSNLDIIHAGTRDEMAEFASNTKKMANFILNLDVPVLRLHIPNHDYLEILYNRLVNDLALWQPAAPPLCPSDSDLDINAPLKREQFHEIKSEREEEDDLMEDVSDLENDSFDRSKSHMFCLGMNVEKCSVLLGTKKKENDKIVGNGQVAFEVQKSSLFTVAGYHQDINHTFFHFTSSKVSAGMRDDFSLRGPIQSNIYAKDFGKWFRDETQVDTMDRTDQLHQQGEGDAFALALHMHFKPDINVKEMLLAINLHNLSCALRPFRDAGHLWVTQLADLFNLVDYEIPGYDIPLVSHDIQIHLDNVAVAYDHALANPSSSTVLRLLFGQAHVNNAMVARNEVSELTCVLERTQLYISNERSREGVHFDSKPIKDKSFVLVGDIGLLHLEVLNCVLSEEQLHRRQTPLVEIRCSNDIVQAWICADSLVTLLNVANDILESDAFKPIPMDADDESASICVDETVSEAGASTWSRPASLAQPQAQLSSKVGQKLQEMIGSAMRESPRETSNAECIPFGMDVVEEFSPDFPKIQERRCSEVESDRSRPYSLSTDDEFCMVDEGIIGCGITAADGAPAVKKIGRKLDYTPSRIVPQHFPVPDEFRADGLGALQKSLPPPLLRYSIRDVSLHIHLFSGSDLAQDEPTPRSYSVDEYRQGQGKGQKVKEEERGGPYRDHSAFVILEVNKIGFLYQLFNKDAPLMCTKLFTIHDVVVKDRLHLSNIKEMLYQYSNQENPRRTCAPMFAVRIVESRQQEGKIRVSLLPIKLNIDQDTMNFLEDFLKDVTSSVRVPDVAAVVADRPLLEVPAHPNVERKGSRLSAHSGLLNMEPLTPSPVLPPSPLGDLSCLDAHLASPIKYPILDADAPLTASAVSVGNLFAGPSRLSKRTPSPDNERESQIPEEDDGSDVEIQKELSNNLFDEGEGDWSAAENINYSNILSTTSRRSAGDDLLARSTMEGSLHPSLIDNELITTASDDDNDRVTVCDEDDDDTAMGVSTQQPYEDEDSQLRGNTFFKEFVFSPAATIYLDYHGKNRLSMDKGGAVLGVLRGLGQLNRAEIELKEIKTRNGLLGIGRCANYAANEWTEHIKSSLPNVIASCGPISPLIQISKGFMDLFWMPVAEMRKEDGHVVKGIQKGVGSFGLSSAAGIVGIAQSVVGVMQTAAELLLHEVQPDSAYLNRRNRRAAIRAPPSDIREGMQVAYGIMSDGVRQTKDDLELAAQEDHASGNSSIRGVLRFATPAVIRPLVMTTNIGYQILGGLRNQLRPDVYQDERHKWRIDEVPGGI